MSDSLLDPDKSGLEQLRSLFGTDGPGVGITRLLDITTEVLAEGHVGFGIDTRAEMCNPAGTVHGGIAATLLDSAMSCAVHSTLAPGERYTTVDIHLHYTRPIRADHGHIVATRGRRPPGLAHRHSGRPPPRRRGQGAGAWHDDLPRHGRRLLGCAPCLGSVHLLAARPRASHSRSRGPRQPRSRRRSPASRRRRSTRRTQPVARPGRSGPQGRERGDVAAEGRRTGAQRPQKWAADDWTDEGDVRDRARGAVRGGAPSGRGPSTATPTARRPSRTCRPTSSATSRMREEPTAGRSCSSASRTLGARTSATDSPRRRRLLEPLVRDAPRRRVCESSTA